MNKKQIYYKVDWFLKNILIFKYQEDSFIISFSLWTKLRSIATIVLWRIVNVEQQCACAL
jgi:hypothetical protein